VDKSEVQRLLSGGLGKKVARSSDGTWTIAARRPTVASGEERDPRDLRMRLVASPLPSPEAVMLENGLHDDFVRALSVLDSDQKTAIVLYFGMADGCDRTYGEVGAMMGVTHQRCYQLVRRALGILKCEPESTAILAEYL
jgi:DNA-directed RNA polymerase sigma subunit (sigma70/sigma32)